MMGVSLAVDILAVNHSNSCTFVHKESKERQRRDETETPAQEALAGARRGKSEGREGGKEDAGFGKSFMQKCRCDVQK